MPIKLFWMCAFKLLSNSKNIILNMILCEHQHEEVLGLLKCRKRISNPLLDLQHFPKRMKFHK